MSRLYLEKTVEKIPKKLIKKLEKWTGKTIKLPDTNKKIKNK